MKYGTRHGLPHSHCSPKKIRSLVPILEQKENLLSNHFIFGNVYLPLGSRVAQVPPHAQPKISRSFGPRGMRNTTSFPCGATLSCSSIGWGFDISAEIGSFAFVA